MNLKVANRSVDFWELSVDIYVNDIKHLNNIIAALRATPLMSSVERATRPLGRAFQECFKRRAQLLTAAQSVEFDNADTAHNVPACVFNQLFGRAERPRPWPANHR